MGNQSTKGFSLVEMIVVIAVIAIIAVILSPKYFGITDVVRKNAALTEAKDFWGLERTNYEKNGAYPTVVAGAADESGNIQSTVTISDGITYTFDGELILTASPSNGSFTYKKWNGTATTNLWIVTCDVNGNMTATHN